MRPLVLLMGTTASGKTKLALRLAKELGGEIICGDALQLWQGISILSAAPTLAEQRTVKHHLFEQYVLFQSGNGEGDLIYEKKSVRDWYESVAAVLSQMSRETTPIIVGGTHYFFLFFLSHDCTPELLAGLHLQPVLLFCDAGIALPERVLARVATMVEQGLLEEVSRTLSRLTPEQIGRITQGYVKDGVSDGVMQAIGLREFIQAAHQAAALGDLLTPESVAALDHTKVAGAAHVFLSATVKNNAMCSETLEAFADAVPGTPEGLLCLGATLYDIAQNTLAYAKKQRKWIYRLERHGLSVTRIDTSSWNEELIVQQALDEVRRKLDGDPANNGQGAVPFSFTRLGDQTRYCDTCEVQITGQKAFDKHMQSRAHRRRRQSKARK